MITFSMEGFNDLNDMLCDLGTVLGKKATRKAARNAMKPVLQEVIDTAPVDSLPDGIHLNESFKLSVSGRTKKLAKKGSDTFLVASVKTTGKEVNKYAALVEFGRQDYSVIKRSAYGKPTNPFEMNVGGFDPNPFMRTALSKHANQVVETFFQGLNDEIVRIQNNRDRIARSTIRCRERRAARYANGG